MGGGTGGGGGEGMPVIDCGGIGGGGAGGMGDGGRRQLGVMERWKQLKY